MLPGCGFCGKKRQSGDLTMSREFDIQYSLPLAERFAYTYYGCCEPLWDRLDMLKQFKNLRKVGCSPWSNAETASQVLDRYYGEG